MPRRWGAGSDDEAWRRYRLYRGMMTAGVGGFVTGIMIASYTYLVWMGCVIASIGIICVFISVIVMCKHHSHNRAGVSVTVNTRSTSVATTRSTMAAMRATTSHHHHQRTHTRTSVTASRTELWELRTRLEQDRSWVDLRGHHGETAHPPVDNGWMAQRPSRGGQPPQYGGGGGGFTQPDAPPPFNSNNTRTHAPTSTPANGGFTNPGPGPGPSTPFDAAAPPSYEEAMRLPLHPTKT